MTLQVMAYSKFKAQKRKQSVLTNNWWVFLFIALSAAVFFHSVAKKNEVISSLDQHLSTLECEKTALLQVQEELLLQVNSQSDPAWIQLTLMKGLGLVPEGQSKVYFYTHED
jgi:hypothetical protein